MNTENPTAGKARQIIPMHYEIGRVALLLDMSTKFVKDRIKAGDLRAFRLGNRIVVEVASIRTFLDNRALGPME
ncbi:MAG: helix-turn-helix domain-containing protein [Verrucomicrobiia bacterium]